MDLSQVQRVIETAPKGANIVLEWDRPCKTRKGSAAVRKAVRMIGRIGVEYDNIGKVIEKRSNGELPEENAGLPTWSEWVQYPFLIKNVNSGQLYLRLYKGTSAKTKPMVKFSIDGNEVQAEDIDGILLASEKNDHENTDCFMVKVENLTRVYSETI